MRLSTFYTYTILFVIGCVLVSACKEPVLDEPGLLNDQISANLVSTDTFEVQTTTISDEVLSGTGLSRFLLGNMDDADFGNTYAGFYTQFKLQSNNITFGASPVLDSIVLQLDYEGSYGPLTQPMDIHVYEVNESLNNQGDQNTEKSYSFNTPTVGQLNGMIPAPNASVFIDGDSLAPHIRIKLSNTFGNKVLNASSSDLVDNTSFTEFFKGLYVTTNQSMSSDGMLYLSPQGALSKLTLYYTDTVAKSYDFPITIECFRLNEYEQDYTGSTAQNYIDNTAAVNDSLIFIQSMASTQAFVKIKDLENLSNIAVNKAELIFQEIADSASFDNSYSPSIGMILFRLDDSGEEVLLYDFDREPIGHFGGLVENVTEGGNTRSIYKFNITRYAQRIVNGEINNNGIHLQTLPSNVIGERSILGGGSHSKWGAKLELTYTKLD